MEYVAVRDLKIRCEVSGTGYPLVLIMGLTASMDWWDKELIDALASRYQVLIFDNRGAGFTVTPEEGEFTAEMFADDTVALMDAKGISRAHILGMSMGGLIAQELAIKYPERVNKLILACTFCGGRHMIQASPEVMKILLDKSGGLDGIFDRALQLMFTPDFLASHGEYVKNFRERYMRAPISAANALRQFMACGKSDTYDRLPEIKNPTLVLSGLDDPLIPPANSHILAERIPNAKLIQYRGTSHGFITEVRDQFVKDLLDFLSDENA
ncbi:MAG TPA: alpha/beta hydrolase [Smithella sp.]|nr:alpha/beta hydrolase [Smithella sp.]